MKLPQLFFLLLSVALVSVARAAQAVEEVPRKDWALMAELILEALAGVAVVVLAYLLREVQRRRLDELRVSEEQWHTLFNNTPVVMIEEDLSAVVRRLDELRAAGVMNIRHQLEAQPALLRELFALIRFTAANRRALEMLGVADTAEFAATVHRLAQVAPPATFPGEIEAVWTGRHTLTTEATLAPPGFRTWSGIFQWMVPVHHGVRDLSRVLLTYTDLSELRTSEERYRALFEGAVEGVFESLPQGGFKRTNPAMARMLGYGSSQELVELKPEEFSHLYVQPGRRKEFLAQLGARNDIADFESEVCRRDGTKIWISENVRAVRDKEGRLEYLQGFVTDITARKRAELALRRSETRYRVLFEHSPIAIIEFDYRPVLGWMNGLRSAGVTDLAAYLAANPQELESALRMAPLVGANDAAVRLYAANSAEELIASYPRLFSAEVSGARRRIYLAMWEGCIEAENELPMSVLDGTARHVHSHWWVPIIEGRPYYERTQLALLDLTEVKTVERALAAKRERLRVTLGAMSEGVVTVDPGGIVRFINDAACELTGRTVAEAINRSIDEVCVLRHEKSGVLVHAPVASVLAADRVMDLPLHTAMLQKHGGKLLVEGRCAPMHDTAGRGIGVVMVLRDVTERARLELELLRASKLEAVGLLAGGIAHDFNNIMAVVMGNLTLAQLDPARSEKSARWLKEAERGALRARDLTQQLLTFAKGGEPVRSAVQLPEVVREAAEFALHGSSARCEFMVDAALWPANADKGQIGQVVQNLIINAAQAMPGGGVIRVTLGNAQVDKDAPGPLAAGRYLSLTIADTGTGIAPEHLARIFEPYFTTKEQGTGLGLATVYSIIKKHRGHVAVESEFGRGTTFRLWLPAAQAEPAAPVSSHSPFDPIRGRILFMDDEVGICEMAKELLNQLGMEATAVTDGAAVVREYGAARAAGRPYDVVMLDLTVPGGMGGLQAMRELLKLDPQVRAIVSSGYSTDPVLANHREHGFRGVVPKPFLLPDLAETIRAVLAQP